MDCIHIAFNGQRVLLYCLPLQGAGCQSGTTQGVSVLLKDTLAHGQEGPGIEPPSLGLMDDLIYLWSQSHAAKHDRLIHVFGFTLVDTNPSKYAEIHFRVTTQDISIVHINQSSNASVNECPAFKVYCYVYISCQKHFLMEPENNSLLDVNSEA